MSQIDKAKIYLAVVGALSLLWIILFVISDAEWVQKINEELHISPPLKAAENSFYNSRIDPIFEKYCVACHDGEKDKGGLRLDSFRQLTFSGKSGADLTQEHNNLLIERMLLPETDRMAMPPYGRDRQTEEELALIALWLTKGATGQLPESEFPEAPAKARVIKFAEIDWHGIEDTRKIHADTVASLQQKYPNVLHYQAKTTHLLVIDSFSMKAQFGDTALADFSPLASLIVEITLKNSQVTDQSIAFLLELTQLKKINLSGTQVSQEVLEQLLSLTNLTQVTIDAKHSSEGLNAQYAERDITLTLVKAGQ
ncbi:MAG: c-type cytochrome domain-containing protein [Thalassotalea sp.]